jgi:uncharacterized membrane protein
VSNWFKITRRDAVMVAVLSVVCVLLFYVELGPKKEPEPGRKERARVVSVDNSGLIELGLLKQGSQILEVEIQSGKWAKQHFRAVNQLRAQLELDKLFAVGDTILVGVLNDADPKTSTLNAQDHYRIDKTIVLFILFALLLLLFGGVTGFNALLSFVFACLVIWKFVIPLCLLGWSAIGVCFAAVTVLCAVIIFIIAGLSRKGITAFCGAFLGVLTSSVMAYSFVHLFNINGAVMPYSQVLLYSGYEYLSLSDIYIGAIFLSSSGAVMDLGMDVAAGMQEVAIKRPGLSRWELLCSGLSIGRAVVGTMTTTLLLAYSGGYLTLLMTFVAQGTQPIDFINNPYIASEMVKTLIGSFGLVLVAPFTAIIGAVVIANSNHSVIPVNHGN